MADTKISALTALTGANVDTAADLLAIIDTSVTTTKKILIDELRTALGPTLSTEQASTSGTSIDFTSIASWVKKITIQFFGVSISGTSNIRFQLGDSGGVETTGYLSGSAVMGSGGNTVLNSTAGFDLATATATNVHHGTITLTLEDATQFTWIANGLFGLSDTAAVVVVGGSKSLSAALDRVRITTANGTDTFDAGAINVLYE